jgi:chitin synthase
MALKCESRVSLTRLCVLIHDDQKVLAGLQLGPKRSPELLDKIPCYTEGEDSLRCMIDSLAALKHDDKRKLLFIICDGNIIGSGNDRTTPRIVLYILGIGPKLDPEPLLFKSVGEGSRALNYGKVYSGLYEFEGHVVPYGSFVLILRILAADVIFSVPWSS